MKSKASVDELVAQLSDARSVRRRVAAKKLRAAPDSRAAPALLLALEKEVSDRRTWETQYQMIMALAACHPSAQAKALFERLLTLDLEPMVHLAAGDALVCTSDDLDASVLAALHAGSLPRAEGAIRALAITHAVPAESTVHAVIHYGSAPGHSQARFWIAAAAAGWPRAIVRAFLEECLSDTSTDTRRAAQAALEGRYLRWNPL
jgi:hypothetical protein